MLIERDGFDLISTDDAGRSSFPTSQGAVVGELVVTSGHGPLAPGSHQVRAEALRDQVIRTVRNIEAVLQDAGSDLEHVFKMECFLRSYEDFAEFNEVYRELMPEPPPPRATFVVELVNPAIRVEMMAWAVIRRRPQ